MLCCSRQEYGVGGELVLLDRGLGHGLDSMETILGGREHGEIHIETGG